MQREQSGYLDTNMPGDSEASATAIKGGSAATISRSIFRDKPSEDVVFAHCVMTAMWFQQCLPL